MDAPGPSESGATIPREFEVSQRYIASGSPLKNLRGEHLSRRFKDIETDVVAEALLQLGELDDRDDAKPDDDPDVDVTGAFRDASEPGDDGVIRCERVARELFPNKKPRAPRTDFFNPKNHVKRIECNAASLRVALRELSADGEDFGPVEKSSKTYTVDESDAFISSVQYRCLAKVYSAHGFPTCNCIITVFKTRDAKHYVLSKGQPHKHPSIAYLISSGRQRGLPPKIKEILRFVERRREVGFAVEVAVVHEPDSAHHCDRLLHGLLVDLGEVVVDRERRGLGLRERDDALEEGGERLELPPRTACLDLVVV